MKQNTIPVPNQIGELIKVVFSEMILHPEKLCVDVVTMRSSFTLYVGASFTDAKRLVGAQASHFNAATTFVRAAAKKHGLQAGIDKIQTVGRITHDQYPPFEAREDWPKEKVSQIVERMAKAVFTHDSAIEIAIVDAPGGSSNIDVIVSETEDPQLVADMLGVFKVLIRPVGKSNFRNLLINIVADKPHDVQPETADGRFAKTVKR